MPSLIKKLARKFLSVTSSKQVKVRSNVDQNPILTDIVINIGSFRLTLKDVTTNEDAIAKIEEILKGQGTKAVHPDRSWPAIN